MVIAPWAVCLGGCASALEILPAERWALDYESGERRARETDRGMLIYYKMADPWAKDPMFRAMSSTGVMAIADSFVLCQLVQSFEPDRRYVGQFGVERAPAIIIVHRDGTYHATTGVKTQSEILKFFQEATPPGAAPRINPYIPRRHHGLSIAGS